MKDLVMIPAFGCDANLYKPFVEGMSGLVRPVTIVSTSDRFDSMVKDVLKEAPGEFLILGTSMGGRLALETALAAPGRVKGLVVIGSGAGPVADVAAGLKRSARIRGGEIADVLNEMGDMVSHLPGRNGPAARDVFVSAGREMGSDKLARQSDALAYRGDSWPRLSEIKCPVLCLWGKHDKFSATLDGQRIAAAVPHGRYVEIDECGHFPTFEYPAESAAILEHWLKDNDLI